MFQRKFVEKIKTHSVFSNSPPSPPPTHTNHATYGTEKCGGTSEATNDNVTHPHFMLDKQSYTRPCGRAPPRTHTHTEMCNTYCYFTATMAPRTRFVVALYVHCLCWYDFQLVLIASVL